MYAIDPHIAELYDEVENYVDDIALIKRLIKGQGPLNILEPFCGTGRICLPLALAGHKLIGIDQARPMLDRARMKIEQLPSDVREQITLIQADVIQYKWPESFDLVLLGSNCLYEFGTAGEQERCIRLASNALRPGGRVYVDNNHMEGELDPSWWKAGIRASFPSGVCDDGTRVESTSEPIWHDTALRLIKERRNTRIVLPTGEVICKEYIRQTHPVSTEEVRSWLNQYDFVIEEHYGDRKGNPYTPNSNRSIFWARKE